VPTLVANQHREFPRTRRESIKLGTIASWAALLANGTLDTVVPICFSEFGEFLFPQLL
jgi:hypothetical protein